MLSRRYSRYRAKSCCNEEVTISEMNTMTSKERLYRILSHEKVDRTPIWLLFPYHRLGCYADVYNLPCYSPVIKGIEQYADTFDRRGYGGGFCLTASPEVKWKSENTTESDGQKTSRQIVEFCGRQLIREHSYGPRGTFIKPLVTEPEELESILEIPWVPVRPNLSSYAPEKKELGDKGLMMADSGDALGVLYGLCRVEDFSMWTILYPELLTKFLDEMHRRMMDLYTYLLDNGIGPVYFLVGAEFAGPPVVSPAQFGGLSGKYVKELVDLIRSYGMKSIVHYHGNLKTILPYVKEIAPDGLHTIEAPPIGDCTLTEARNALGDDIVLIGNIQYDDLRRGTTDEIRELVRGCFEETGGRSFILSPTAGPYESYIDTKMVQNYLAFLEEGHKLGVRIGE